MTLLADAAIFCLENPGCQAYLFRRTMPELEKTHIKKIKQMIPPQLGVGKYNETKHTYEFINGSTLWFCHCEKEDDVQGYQSAEMHWLGLDEASHFSPTQITYLRTRVRLGDWKQTLGPDKVVRLPRVCFASNPGGPGHDWLKTSFILRAPPGRLFYDPSMKSPRIADDKGWLSLFIPAGIDDNKYIDPSYAGVFTGLAPELARALRDGDWDAVVGAAIFNLDAKRHKIRPFRPPRHWTTFMSMDWGTFRPFSVGWYTVSEGAVLEAKDGFPEVYLPTGAVIRFRETYGWNGRPNEGIRWSPQKLGARLLEIEAREEIRCDYRIADTEMWANRGGPSSMEWMESVSPGKLAFRKSQKDRRRNYQEIIARLAGSPRFLTNGKKATDPMVFITSNCFHFWRTIPALLLDDLEPEKGPGTKGEDHVYDEFAYALRSRPFVTTELDREDADYDDASDGDIEDSEAAA